ncbi:MAG: hypothetical protein MJ138_06160 [Kiritimatiellae bacterium]|nr:hypothetical protein [Kiritimatiellia bacterium]
MMTLEEEDARAAKKRELDEYLAKIRKNIADSRALVEQANLRISETDRFLEQQGVTREQVLNMRFSKEQKLAVNEELRRRGLPPIEDDETAFDFDAATAEVRASQLEEAPESSGGNDALAERQRKFGNFMQAYRL